MKVKFTKPTMNFAAGDVVNLDARQKKLVDEYIEEYVEGNEEDRSRYVEVKGKKAETAVNVRSVSTATAPSTQLHPAPVDPAKKTGN